MVLCRFGLPKYQAGHQAGYRKKIVSSTRHSGNVDFAQLGGDEKGMRGVYGLGFRV